MGISEIYKQQKKEIEEKTTILLAGAEKVKQLEKEIEEIKEKNIILEGNKIGQQLAINELQHNIEEQARNSISKDKIKEKIKDLEDLMILFTNDKEKFNRYRYARNILEKLLGE